MRNVADEGEGVKNEFFTPSGISGPVRVNAYNTPEGMPLDPRLCFLISTMLALTRRAFGLRRNSVARLSVGVVG